MKLFGYDFIAEYIICGLAGVILLLFIFDIILFVKISGLKKRIERLKRFRIRTAKISK